MSSCKCNLLANVVAPQHAVREAECIAESHSWSEISERAVNIALALNTLDGICNCSCCRALRLAYEKARHIASSITLAEARASAREIVHLLEPYQ